MKSFDLVIIGGGICGMTAAIYAARANIRTCILEQQVCGGLVNWTNTVENAIETSEWIRKNNVKSIRLVTSNYHIPRSLEEFRSLNPQVKIIPHPVYSENVSPQWWKNGGSFYLIASEYNKFLYVYLRTRLEGN